MNVGDIIVEDGEVNVILEIRSSGDIVTIPLRKHIEKTVVVYFGGEYRTIEEIKRGHCEAYMSGVVVHER